MPLCLARWRFTPQKPMKKAYEQSPAAVKMGQVSDSIEAQDQHIERQARDMKFRPL